MTDHHASHALYAHVDSRFSDSLVVSFDGGGNDGSFLVRLS
jgi:predicted NodU family carbamoyl transferase